MKDFNPIISIFNVNGVNETHQLKFLKVKNQGLIELAAFEGSIATHGQWLSYQTAQIQKCPSSQKILFTALV